MANTIKQSFSDYASRLEITDRQESTVSIGRRNAVDAIKSEIELHEDESRVIGSWARNTLTRYLSEGDVDVMVIMHYGKNKEWETADGTIGILNKFKRLLQNTYPNTNMQIDENCVTMQFSEFRLDVVPSFSNTGGYYKIPDTIKRRWIQTDPLSFAERITTVNKNMNETFIPIIKMAKGWNREVGWPIKSFHLENLLYHHYKTYNQGYTYPSTLNVFFSKLPQYLAGACYEPVRGERVDTYLDNSAQTTKRQIAISKAQRAATKSASAIEYEEKYPNTPEYAINEWKELFGTFFPAYG